MKYLRVFDTEADYESVKDSLVYPTISYTVDIGKVCYTERPIPNRIIATYGVTEEQVGQDVLLATIFGDCSDVILDGKSLNTPISIIGSGVVTPTSYGIYSSMTFTDDSWVVAPSQSWEITFDKPLQAGDMIGLSLLVPKYNVEQNTFMLYEEVVSQGALTPIEPNNTQKFKSNYTTAVLGTDFNILMCAFTPIDEYGTVTEDNFIGATYECKSGGSPSNVIVQPTEATTYTVEYRFSKGHVTRDVISSISTSATSVDLSSCDTSNVTNMGSMFYYCKSLTSVTFGKNFNTSNVISMTRMFGDCVNLTSLDLSSWDTSNVTDMSEMFAGCSGLTSVTFGDNFDTSEVTDMGLMFRGCSGLTSLDLNSFDTSNVTDMHWMFDGCTSLTSLDLSSFDMSNVTNTIEMFDGCNNLTSLKYFKKTPSTYLYLHVPNTVKSLDLSSWDSSYITSMESMFANSTNLTSITFGDNFDTSNVTDMTSMFYLCPNLTSLDLSSFNTSNVTNMRWMFAYCESLTSLDLSSFDTSNVTNMFLMFNSCHNLSSITMTNDVSLVTNVGSMFSSVAPTGTFYYNGNYDYSKIIAELPSTWTAVDINGD